MRTHLDRSAPLDAAGDPKYTQYAGEISLAVVSEAGPDHYAHTPTQRKRLVLGG